MIDIKDGKAAVFFARNVVDNYIKKGKILSSNLKGIFTKKQGVFISLQTYPNHDLRGCIGIPIPVMTLKKAISESAISATKDPRFQPLEENELDMIIIEVTIPFTSELPSFVFVCPSNCGSLTFTDRTAVRPSLASSPDRTTFLRKSSFLP